MEFADSAEAAWWWDKAELVHLGRRATFAELFAVAHGGQLNAPAAPSPETPGGGGGGGGPGGEGGPGGGAQGNLGPSSGSLVAVVNADVMLDEGGLEDLVRKASVAGAHQSCRGEGVCGEVDLLRGACFALSRWERRPGGPRGSTGERLHLTAPSRGWSPALAAPSARAFLLPRADSQDAWVFRTPLSQRAQLALARHAVFFPGLPRCDNRLAHVLAEEGGLDVSNPALALPVHHLHAGPAPQVERPKARGFREGSGQEAGQEGGGGYREDSQVPGAVLLVPVSESLEF